MTLDAEDFRGTWGMLRQITDRLGVMDGQLTGQAVFAGVAGRLRYDETGTLTLVSGAQMEATRCYEWVFDQNDVRVFFEDGTAFHSFCLTGTAHGTPHLCGEDLYKVTYDFADWPVWTATWTVAGPRKDYTSVTRYTRP